MTNDALDTLIREWASLGAAFDAEPAAGPVDLERVLLRTARQSPDMPRLFIMAATWLNTYGELVALHRLRRLIRDELSPGARPVLGLLLDIAQQGTHPAEFRSVLCHLPPASPTRPLFRMNHDNGMLRARAERRASEISRRWNLWCDPIELKPDALRSSAWIMHRHPGLILRADFRGDLRASILASLHWDRAAGDSELALARCSGGSRAQVRAALRNLQLTGRVNVRPASDANRNTISLVSAA